MDRGYNLSIVDPDGKRIFNRGFIDAPSAHKGPHHQLKQFQLDFRRSLEPDVVIDRWSKLQRAGYQIRYTPYWEGE